MRAPNSVCLLLSSLAMNAAFLAVAPPAALAQGSGPYLQASISVAAPLPSLPPAPVSSTGMAPLVVQPGMSGVCPTYCVVVPQAPPASPMPAVAEVSTDRPGWTWIPGHYVWGQGSWVWRPPHWEAARAARQQARQARLQERAYREYLRAQVEAARWTADEQARAQQEALRAQVHAARRAAQLQRHQARAQARALRHAARLQAHQARLQARAQSHGPQVRVYAAPAPVAVTAHPYPAPWY